MNYVLIDPQMFMLEKEEDIACNIEFFMNVIELNNSGIIEVCLYKEIIDRLMATAFQPFPINVNDIEDNNLKRKLIFLNNNFNRSIMNKHKIIDIDSCYGNQMLSTDRSELENVDEYYVFFNMLLTDCYRGKLFDDRILVGYKKDGIRNGEFLNLSCTCEKTNFTKQFKWILPNDFLTDKQKAIKELRSVLHKNSNIFVRSPEVKRSDHHNKVQKEEFSSYEQLSTKNRRILDYLRYYGLRKVEFKDFSPDTSREIGTIKIIKIEQNNGADVISGWLFGCIQYRILVELYFPIGVGKLLYTIIDTEFTSKNMDELKSSLGIQIF